MRERDLIGCVAGLTADGEGDPSRAGCWLCGRPLGWRVEWHHPVPKSRGGRQVVPLHPICHRAIHANFSNVELARRGDLPMLRAHPAVSKFLRWIADKPADFHARTAGRRK